MTLNVRLDEKYYGSFMEIRRDTVNRQPVAGHYVPFILWWRVPLIYDFDVLIVNVQLTLAWGWDRLTLSILSAVLEQRQK